MHTVLKHFNPKQIAYLGILMFLFLINKVSAQVVVAGTTFTPTSPSSTKTYYAIGDISQYGMIQGTITPTSAWTPSTAANVFNSSPSLYYAITNNPDTLDNTRYENLAATPTYMFVNSPVASTPSSYTYLSYTVSGLLPGSNLSATVTYCNVEGPKNNATCEYQQFPIRGVINPDQYNPLNGGTSTTQVLPGQCATYTFSSSPNTGQSNVVSSSGIGVFNLNLAQTGACTALGIKKIEITGTPAPTITGLSNGSSVCEGEQTILQLNQNYDPSTTYQWQQSTNGGTSWSNISGATNNAYLATAGASGTSAEYQVKVTYSGTTFTTSPVTITGITCCVSGGSRQTVYYNDFGTFDLVNDPSGKTYYTWDYTNYLNPLQVKHTTPTPFQYSLSVAPPGTAYISGTTVGDNKYTVAAGFNGNGPYTDPTNGVTYPTSYLAWAANIGGFSTPPNPGYDHSGNFDGAALLINVPAMSKGNVIYSDTINNLCGGETLYFEAWMNVFTSSASGTYYPVNVQVKLIDNSLGGLSTTSNDSTTANDQPFPGTTTDGCGCWVELTGQLKLQSTSTSMIFQLIQNQNDNAQGDDLVLDDITVLACAPPAIDLVFNKTTLATTTNVCTSDMYLYSLYTNALTSFYSTNLEFLFQYSYTPTVNSSWVNIGTPQPADSYDMTDPKANAAFTGIPPGSSDVYFRVVAAEKPIFTANNNFIGADYASANNVCLNYSVSDAISADVLCALPIKLISFNGVKNGSVNTLTWSTAMEENNSYFTLQRSSDGKNFISIATIKGQGNSNIVTNYSYNDNMPLSGVNYYRLQQTDFNGTSTYSTIIAIDDANTGTSNSPSVVVYPNPNNGTFDVSILNPGQSYTLEVIDVQGRQVYYNTGSNAAEAIKVSQLSQGLYIVKVTTNNEVITKKVVVY